MIKKLPENALIFGAPKRLYTASLPVEVTKEYISEEFGRTENVNLNFNGKPIRIHEGKITYYLSDGGFARQLMANLVEDAKAKDTEKKKKAKEKIIVNPDTSEIQSEETETND